MSNAIATIIASLANFKTGYKTSEFWVALAPAVIAILNIVGVHLSNNTTTHLIIIVWGAVAAVYVAARSFIKSVHIGHAVNLAALIREIEHDAENVVNPPVGP